jgi:putative (di)nucleoside polyphosphate hydrolase
MAGQSSHGDRVDRLTWQPLLQCVAHPEDYDLEMKQAFFTATCLSLAFCAVRAVEGGLSLSLASELDSSLTMGAGALVFNDRGQVFVGQRGELPMAAWQLPQGGIRRGEGTLEAMLRVLHEEIGTQDVDIITQCYGWLRYEFSPTTDGRPPNDRCTQQQKWFALRFDGADEAIDIETAKPEFSAWRWAPLEQLPALITPFKRPSYAEAARMFGRTADA